MTTQKDCITGPSNTGSEDFIQERQFLKGVSDRTIEWYRGCFRAFNGAIDPKQAIIGRIGELKVKGTSPITINSYLRCMNAYFMWLHTEHGKERVRIPKLKEEQKILGACRNETVFDQELTTYRRCNVRTLLILRSRNSISDGLLATLSPAQVSVFINRRPKLGVDLVRAWVICMLLVDTGLRISEALALTLTGQDVDYDNLVLKV